MPNETPATHGRLLGSPLLGALVSGGVAAAALATTLARARDRTIAAGAMLIGFLAGLQVVRITARRAYYAFVLSGWSGLVYAAVVTATLYLIFDLGPADGWFWAPAGFLVGGSLAIELAGRVLAARRGSDWAAGKREVIETMARRARQSGGQPGSR